MQYSKLFFFLSQMNVYQGQKNSDVAYQLLFIAVLCRSEIS